MVQVGCTLLDIGIVGYTGLHYITGEFMVVTARLGVLIRLIAILDRIRIVLTSGAVLLQASISAAVKWLSHRNDVKRRAGTR